MPILSLLKNRAIKPEGSIPHVNPTDKLMVNRYINTFKNKIAPILKDNVSIKCSVYPYPKGAILVSSFNFDEIGNTEYKPCSVSLKNAALRANVKIPPGSDKCKIIFKKNTIIEIKPFEAKAWSAEIAADVISHIVEAVSNS